MEKNKPDLPDLESFFTGGRLTCDAGELPPLRWKEARKRVEELGRPLTDEEVKEFEIRE